MTCSWTDWPKGCRQEDFAVDSSPSDMQTLVISMFTVGRQMRESCDHGTPL